MRISLGRMLVGALLSMLSILPLLAEDRMIVFCDPDSDQRQDLAVYTAPAGYVAIEKLACGDSVTVVSADRGFSKIITPNNKVGYVLSSRLRKPERSKERNQEIERMEAELQELKSESSGSSEVNQRIERLEAEVRQLKSQSPLPPSSGQASSSTASGQTRPPGFPTATHPAPYVERDRFPRAEIFGGYSYARTNGGLNLNGWEASVSGNLSSYLGIVGDISGHYSSEYEANAHFYTFLGGPRFFYRGKRATAFGHAMFGVTHLGAGVDILGFSLGLSDTVFAMAFGGGLDLNVSKRLAVRAIQVDYLPIRWEGETFNNVRASAGLVVKF